MNTLLRSFTHALLVNQGAIVDIADQGLDVIAPPSLAERLGTTEYTRLVFATDGSRRDGRSELRVDYDAPLLERMGTLVGGLHRVAWLPCDVAPPRAIDAEEAVARAVTLHNGVVRVITSEPVSVVRLGVVFEYELLADMREGGLTCVWLTPETRSVARMTRWPNLRQLQDRPASGPPAPPPARLPPVPWAMALAATRTALASTAGGFLESMTRRRQRDAGRLREYSLEIDRAIRAKLARRGTSDASRQRERDRLDATDRAYRTRLADLADRYRLQVRLLPVCILASPVPGVRIDVRLMRRTASRTVSLSWNAVDQRLETRCCDNCDSPAASAWLCDEQVHYLCPACFAPCGTCGKPFCRACLRGCGRCRTG